MTLTRIKEIFQSFKDVVGTIQNMVDVPGHLYVDIFGIIIMVRLLAVLKGFPPLSTPEAAVWGATIGSLAYTNGGPKPS